MQDANNRLYNFLIFIVVTIVSFKLSGLILENFFELPHINETTGAPAAGIFNLIMGAGSLMIFLPIMLFFIVTFWFLAKYLIKRFDLL